MPPKHGGGATIKGKQAAVHEGQFLHFLRSVGYKDELPPSTVAWLESAPVFKFVASKLSHDNFVTPEEEQEYNELMLARGPDASLYDAVDGFGSDMDSDSFAASTRGQKETDPFLADLSDEEVSRMLEAEEAYSQQLEQQISDLRKASDALDATNRQQGESQGPMHFTLNATAANELSAAKVDAQQLSEAIDYTLGKLEAVCCELCTLAGQPQLWLLCAADQTGYKQMDDHINAQHTRGVQVLDVCDIALDLHHPASPTTVNPMALAAAKAAGPQTLQATGGMGTPHGGQQQGLTARQTTHGQSLADALKEAKDKRRAAHAARNAALNREMSRQQHAFLQGYQRDLAAAFKEQGLRAEIAAVQQVRSHTGEFAALLSKGPESIPQLQQQLRDAEAAMMLIKHNSLKHLIQEVADHNDCHIVVGDYDRHLAKVNYAMDRKRAMLESLMNRASLHLVLLLLCVEELRRLSVLSGQLQGAASILEGHIAVTEERMQRCAAALEAVNKAQSLSNVQASDSYLCALMAAADGTLVLPDQQQKQQQLGATAAAASAAGKDTATPRGSQLAHSSALGGLFTPSFAPSSSLFEKLQGLSLNLDRSTEQLHKLLDLLPAQMDQHKASAVRLHRTAFPPGQPMHSAGGSTLSGTGMGMGGSVAGSSVAGSIRAGSMAGSTQRGSAAASLRSDGSLSSLTQHPQLLLTLPEVAEATAALKGCVEQLNVDVSRVIHKHNDMVAAWRCGDKELERQVMAKFFTAPEELAADVDALKAQVQQLQLGSLLSF